MKKAGLTGALLLFVSFLTFGWGFYGHKIINQLAIYALPKQIQPFYYRHQEYLVENSVRPDVRRNTDKAEAPRHFIDIDVFGPEAVHTMPKSWTEAAKKYTADTLRKYGIVPWHVVKIKNRLTNAFRAKNADSILFYSADLGHYIEDAHVPLHATVNYDGQLTNQAGFHSFWESKLPEMHLAQYNLYSGKATYLKNTETEIWKTVRTSYALAGPMLELERTVTKNFPTDRKYITSERNGRVRKYYSDEFAKRYQQEVQDVVAKRMREAANQVASFWYTCWVDGGKPNLSNLLSTKLLKLEKKRLKTEKKAWQRNELYAKKLFLGTVRAGSE